MKPVFTNHTLDHVIRIQVIWVRIWFVANAIHSLKVVVVAILFIGTGLILK